MIEKIERRLRELMPSRDETIFEAARYSLLSKGKRLRPMLTLATAATFGVDPLTALDPACALEMIHAYSLIHDDLPCMDNDDLRRGKPTLHKVYGEAIALLAGDYLLTFAFEVIVNANLGREQRLQIVKTVAMRCGAPGMIGGQVIDMEQTGKEIEEDTLVLMHEGKTAALFTACLECGSLVAGYPPTPLFQTIGKEFGLAYQFQNDVQDMSTTGGKKAGSDAVNQKQTAVTLFGIDGAKAKVQSLKKSIDEKFMGLPKQGGPLAVLIGQILC